MRYRDVRLGVDLLKPPALFPNMTGRNVRLVWTLDGAFDAADYSYRLTSPGVKFDDTGFVDVARRGARAAVAVADAGPAPAQRQGDHRHRRCRRRDPRQRPKIEGWLTRHPQAGARRQSQAHQRAHQRQDLAADRPRHRAVRSRPCRARSTAISSPASGSSTSSPTSRSCPGPAARAAVSSAPPRRGCGGSTTASSAT